MRTTSVADRTSSVGIKQASEGWRTTEELSGCDTVGIPLHCAARRLECAHGLAATSLVTEWSGVHFKATSIARIAA